MKLAVILFTILFSVNQFTKVASAQSKEEFNIRMLEAAKNDQADSVKYWLDKGANVNYEDQDNLTALHYAIFNTEYLLRSAQIQRKQLTNDSDYFKLWVIAILNPNYYKGGLVTCRVLIRNGANINHNKSGYTPLMLACSKGDLRVCKLLLDNGASTNLLDAANNDALSYIHGYKRVENFLINHQNYSEVPTYYETLLIMDSLISGNELSKALETGQLALSKAQIELVADHRDIDMINKRLITLNEELSNYKEAQNIRDLIIEDDLSETKKKVLGMMQYPGYFGMLSRMAKYAMDDGEYLKAEIIINGLIGYSAKYNINESESLPFKLWLSHIYLVLDEFDKSEILLNELLKKNTEDKQHDKNTQVSILLEFSQLNRIIGNIRLSKLYSEKALNEIGTLDDTYAQLNSLIAFSILGWCYSEEGDISRAEVNLQKSVDIGVSFKNSHFSQYSASMINLGFHYLSSNQIQNAKIAFEKLKTEFETNNLYNLEYCTVLENLAVISYKQNDIFKAMYYSESSQKFKINQNRTQDFDLSLLASINYRLEKYREADSLYKLTAIGVVNSLKQKFLYLSENERNLFLKTKNRSFEQFQSFSYDYHLLNPSIACFAFDNELFRKGLLLNTSLRIRKDIYSSKDSTLIYNWEELIGLRKRINFLETQPEKQRLVLPELEEQANQLEKLLIQKSQVYRQAQSEQQIQWQDVQSKLKEGEAAIEFSSFNYFHNDWTDSTLYCALVLKKGMEHPVIVPLFEQKQLDSLFAGGNAAPDNLYASSRGTEIVNDNIPLLANGDRLYDLVWKPLEKELRDVKTIYYSPSGSLHQIAFAALPTDSTHYLCDKINLVQLSSTRQLATSAWQAKPNKISSVTLFGGIKYDLDSLDVAELQRSLPKNELAVSRGFLSDSTRSSKSFGFLEGTKSEVESISTHLKAKNIKTALYTGINGNEETFKALSNQNISVIHIATHGFFYPDEKQKPEDLDRMILLGEQKFRYVPNPLLRSGLVLAGGNRAWKGEEPIPGMENGILTAQEISEMNLSKTELVVLSACETGLGDIKGGEGVFGLQRAFKLAGVKTIIMSLWKVPDAETSELMQSFYQKWLGGMDKHGAFRIAQKELRAKYPKITPKEWAGFVMVD